MTAPQRYRPKKKLVYAVVWRACQRWILALHQYL